MADGQFVNGRPTTPLAIGEEGYFYPLAAKRKRHWLPVVAPAIPVLAMLVLFFSTLLPSEKAFAYVQLEMDSSIEFGVDSAYHVVSIRELDEGGKKLIDQLGTWKGEELGLLIKRSIAISIGELNEKVTITTATDQNNETSEIQLNQLVLKASAVAVKKDVNVHLKKATFSQRDKSIEENIPVGQKVEHFVSLVKEDKSKIERDSKAKSENYIKALKVRNKPAPIVDQVTETQTTSKFDTIEQKAVEKEKATNQDKKPKASSKVEEKGKPTKTEKAKPATKTSKFKTTEVKQEPITAPVEKVKPIVIDEPEKILEEIVAKEAENQETHPETQKEKTILNSIIVNNVQEEIVKEAISQKSKKPIIEEVIHEKIIEEATPVKSHKDRLNGDKQEQK